MLTPKKIYTNLVTYYDCSIYKKGKAYLRNFSAPGRVFSTTYGTEDNQRCSLPSSQATERQPRFDHFNRLVPVAGVNEGTTSSNCKAVDETFNKSIHLINLFA